MKGLDVDLASEFIEYFNEAAHVGPFEMMGQVDIHVDCGIHRLGSQGAVEDDDGILDPLHTHLGDLNVPMILEVLYVDHAVYVTRALSDSHTVTLETVRPTFRVCILFVRRS